MRPTKHKLTLRLLALALAAASPLLGAEPALWKIENGERDVYLFGTMHALPKDLPWLSEGTQRAFRESRRLVVEVVPDRTMAEAVGDFMRRRAFYDDGDGLLSALGEADWARIAAIAAEVGMPVAQLQRMRPWAAWFALTTPALARAGFDPAAGADQALIAMAAQRNRQVLAIEDPVAQLERVASVDEAQQLAMLRMFLDDYPRVAEQLRKLHQPWARGDEAILARLVHEPLREVPGLYEALMTARNHEWVEEIRALVVEGHAAFVAVGAAHLVGDDGVPALLREAGIAVERL